MRGFFHGINADELILAENTGVHIATNFWREEVV